MPEQTHGRMLDGQPTVWFRRPPQDDAGYSIDASDGGRLYRNGELVGYVEKMTYDRDVNGWWLHYKALPGRWLDRLTKFARRRGKGVQRMNPLRDGRDEIQEPWAVTTRLRDEEIWSLDVALAAVIADSVRRLRDMEHGYPGELTAEEWQRVLTEIADGFQSYHDAQVVGHDYERPDVALDLLKEWWQHLWD